MFEIAGNQPSLTPMMYCRNTPDTNSGIDALARPSVTIERSSSVSFFRGGDQPAEDAERQGQHQCEHDELGRVATARGRTRSITALAGLRVRLTEVEGDDVVSRRPNWVIIGSSSPSRSLSCVDPLLEGRTGRRSVEPDRPGTTRVSRKTTTIRMNSVTSESASRRSTNRSMWPSSGSSGRRGRP